MHNKNIEYCEICGEREFVNRKPPHHVVPRRLNTNSTLRIWLCRECHVLIHKAEFKGICRLPRSEEEYQKWKNEMKSLSVGVPIYN